MKFMLILIFLVSQGDGGYISKIPSSITVPYQTLDACVAAGKTIVNDSNDMAYCTDQSTGLTTGRITKG